MDQEPIINCHTHVFTIVDVPPRLAKTILPWPLYLIVNTNLLAGIFGWLTRKSEAIKASSRYKKLGRALYMFRMGLNRYFLLTALKFIIGAWILLFFFHELYTGIFRPWLINQHIDHAYLDSFDRWLVNSGLLIFPDNWVMIVLLIIIFCLVFASGRNFLWFLLRKFNRFFKLLPGKHTTELLKRYLNIVRFANYAQQSRVYSRLKQQYPPGSKMVVLPMDMEFMGAGKPKRGYAEQMAMLADIKEGKEDQFLPFVFIDPRRTEAGGKPFFQYHAENGKVELEDCFVRDYIETREFSGFKIYPALGYYPFDKRLLPLWKYAADRGIPIMTHCIRGVIYYRGAKVKDWDEHPVFCEYLGKDDKKYKPTAKDYRNMLLPQMKAVDVQEIFTHPLNYACLYKKELLIKIVRKYPELYEVFGYDLKTDTMQYDLSHLKICFGHFGGEDEWLKYFEKDRSNFGHHLLQHPEGIDFIRDSKDEVRQSHDNIWHTADWYSIICSLILQHDHVYADISYILHGDLEILPLLRSTLQHEKLRTQVLYGSDYYVVRNHKSDKNMLADIRGGLLKHEFEQIACVNPVRFLKKEPLATE